MTEMIGREVIKPAIGRIITISQNGWGFISSKEIKFTRIFFHWTALKQNTVPFLELKVGMKVEFTPIKLADKGYRAIHVRVLETKESDASVSSSEMSPLPE